MAKPISWLPRLADIRRSVAGSSRTHYTRRDLQTLFQIQPRAAGKLMASLDRGAGVGNAHLVAREVLQRFLDDVHAAPAPTLPQAESKVTHRRPRVLVRKDLISDSTMESLPATVSMSVGEVTLRWTTYQGFYDALQSLLGALENDEQNELYHRYTPAGLEEAARSEALRAQRDEIQQLLDDTDAELKAWIAARRAKKPPTSVPDEPDELNAKLYAQRWL